MNLQPLAVPITPGDAIALYDERVRSRTTGDIGASIRLLAYMAWPNDDERRDSWVATLAARQATLGGPVPIGALPVADLFGGLAAISDPAFRVIVDDLTDIMTAWPPVADVMSRLVDMAHDQRVQLRGGVSITKAVDLSDFEPEGKSRAQTQRLWGRFREVAHLIAGAAFLSANGPDAISRSLFAATWLVPEAVISIAAGFEEFGLQQHPHGQTDSLLPAATTWRLPDRCRPQQAYLVPRKLSDDQLAFLTDRRSPKPYQSKP